MLLIIQKEAEMQPVNTTYSLWLIPHFSSREHDNLRSIIHKLSWVFNTPIFDPHVTLLGGIVQTREVVLARAKQFADKQSAIKIDFNGIDSRENEMQVFFAKVAEPNDDLTNAHILASEIMFGSRNYDYFPHLSLAYGNLTKDQVKVLKDEMFHNTTFRPENNDFIAWGVSVWNTPTRDVRTWSEEQHFKFPIR